MTQNKFFIIDFDSTFTQVEALEELAKISLKDNPDREIILNEIKTITDAGMEGKISISESLARRIKMLNAGKRHIDLLIKHLNKKITPSFSRNKGFFKRYCNNIFVLSAGFKEFIIPVLRDFYVPERNIFANDFLFDKKGRIIGLDESNLLAKENGKIMQLKKLNLNGEVYAIGDGYTDFQLKEAGLATKFFAFTENVKRESAVKKADYVVQTFDEFLEINGINIS